MDQKTGTKPRKPSKPRTGRGRPRKGAEADTDTLLEAALASFAENGFNNTSLRTIATMADVDVALISYRYGSKLGLWTAVVSAVAGESLQIIDEFIAHAQTLPQEERVAHICEKLVDLIFSRPHFARLMISEIVGNADLERQTLIAEVLGKPIHVRLVAFIENQGVARHTLDDDIALFASISLIGLLSTTQHFLSKMIGLDRTEAEFKMLLTSMVTRLLT